MKSIYIFNLFLLILIIAACSKDQGNYVYSDVNRLSFLDLSGDSISGQQFEINAGDTLVVEVVVKGTLASFDTSKVSYTWMLGEVSLGTGNKIAITVDKLQPGKNLINLVGVDQTTGLDYLNIFTVSVNATISKGIFVLAKNVANNSILYLKSSLNIHDDWFEMTSIGEKSPVSLGNQPVKVELEGKYKNYPRFVVVTRDGPHPIIFVDLPTMEPYLLYRAAGKALNGGDLHPSYFQYGYSGEQANSYVMDQGRVRYMSKGFLGDDVFTGREGLNYDFGEGAIAYDNFGQQAYGRFLMGYDKISKRILFFEAAVNRKFAFPKINEAFSTGVIGDMEYIGSGLDMKVQNGYYYGIILRNGNVVHNYSCSYLVNPQINDYQFSKITENAIATIPGIEKAVNLCVNKWEGSYYYAVGRTIYRFPFFSLNIQPYYTLPEDGTGDIVAWNFDRDETDKHRNIGIATYNPSASSAKKGSFYHYEIKEDTDKKPLTLVMKSLYKIDHAVSIAMGIQ